jgi:RNA polymerase sigma-70 factor (ECF subfamily)
VVADDRTAEEVHHGVDAEDVLQDVWLAWAGRHRDPGAEPVENPRAYLVRVAANAALAKRAEVNRRRESYVGQWLPEPLVSDEEASVGVERAESLSMALLVVHRGDFLTAGVFHIRSGGE